MARRGSLSRNCQVCKLGYEMVAMVSRMLINGASYADVARELQLYESTGAITRAPAYAAIRRHCQNHLVFKDEAIRRHLERRAIQDGIDLENAVDGILRPIAVAEVTMAKGFSNIIEDRATPTVKETLDAAKLVHEFERSAATSTDAAEAIAQVNLILQAVREVVPPELWTKITGRLQELEQQRDNDSFRQIEAAPDPEEDID